jgi:hypothetical protein
MGLRSNGMERVKGEGEGEVNMIEVLIHINRIQ